MSDAFGLTDDSSVAVSLATPLAASVVTVLKSIELDILADGKYYFRVMASDREANPPPSARESQLVSAPVMIDNTFATPYLCRPFEWGANIVTHSTTKFIGGHGTSIGGAIVDGGNFNWKDNPRFPNFNTPDPSYHGLVYADLAGAGLPPFIIKSRVQILRDIGACQQPFNSWLFLQGIETLSAHIPHKLLLSNIMLTPSCGTGSRTVEETLKICLIAGSAS